MLRRLLGLETEYAIRFSPANGRPGPGNQTIFKALKRGITAEVRTAPAEFAGLMRDKLFVENGGAYYYEALVSAMDGGLIEGATPECRNPSQLLLYQRASERLLQRALKHAQADLRASGHDGTVGLLKNCRDAFGHTYGAQDSYEVTLASGWSLWLWRVALTLVLPLFGLSVLLYGVVLVVLIPVILVILLIEAVAAAFRTDEAVFSGSDDDVDRWISGVLEPYGRPLEILEGAALAPAILVLAVLLRIFAFRRVRRALTTFVVARSPLTGSGTLTADEQFHLSEKAGAINCTMRNTILPSSHPIFDMGNLMKALASLIFMDPAPMLALYRSRVRMQLGYSDSNVAEVAEYLKIGTTALVVDMAEAGVLDDLPGVSDPVRSLQAVSADASLTYRIPLDNGASMTALEVQRLVLGRAQAWIAAHPAPSMEAQDIVALWDEVLTQLEDNPAALVGRLDWVTKKYLLDACRPSSYAARKKIDLKYHELGDGYLAELRVAGLSPTMTSEDEVEAAIFRPPDGSPARARGRLIGEIADRELAATVSWGRVALRERPKARKKVIRLDDYR